MTEDRISSAYMDLIIREKRQNKVLSNVFFQYFECDIIEITGSDYSTEIEIKISRSDFKHDVQKKRGNVLKHDLIKDGKRTNYFYYLVPENMITVDEVPEFAGLIYVSKKLVKLYDWNKGLDYYVEKYFFSVKKSAPKLHKNKFTEYQLKVVLMSAYYRFHSLRFAIEKNKRNEL